MDLTDVLKVCGPSPSGTGTVILFANKKEFTTIQKPTAYDSAVAPEDLVTISADHVFAAGKGWKKLEITDGSGKLDSNVVGEIDSKSFEHMFNGFVPNQNDPNLGLLSALSYCEWIFLIPTETSAGTVYKQIGSEQHPAYCQDNNFTTDVTGGKKGTTYSIKSVGHAAHVPTYSGAIVYQP